MAGNESNGVEAQNGNGQGPRKRRRRTPEERLEAEKSKLARQQEKVKQAQVVVTRKQREAEQMEKAKRRSNDRASDGILGAMFKRRVRDGDRDARALYVRLRRDFPTDREQVVLQFDEEIEFAKWRPAASKANSEEASSTTGHSSFPQP